MLDDLSPSCPQTKTASWMLRNFREGKEHSIWNIAALSGTTAAKLQVSIKCSWSELRYTLSIKCTGFWWLSMKQRMIACWNANVNSSYFFLLFNTSTRKFNLYMWPQICPFRDVHLIPRSAQSYCINNGWLLLSVQFINGNFSSNRDTCV